MVKLFINKVFKAIICGTLTFTNVIGQEITRLHTAGQYDRLLSFATKIDSIRGDEAMLIADAYFRKRQPERAEQILTKVIGRGYTTEEAHWQLAQVLLAQQKWLSALEHTEKALAFDKRNFTYLKTRAGILLQLGKYHDAEKEYLNLIRIKPGDESQYWLAYQSIAEQEDYRRGKNFLITHLQKFKTPEFQNRVYDALVRTYYYTLRNSDSALYMLDRWKAAVGNNSQNIPQELLILNNQGKYSNAIALYSRHKALFKKSRDGILFDEIPGREYALRVFFHPEKMTYTAYIMDAEMNYFQGKILWKKVGDNQSEATVELLKRSVQKIYPIPLEDYSKVRLQTIRIAKSVNNIE